MSQFIPMSEEVLQPILWAQFPYVHWTAIHDARTPKTHLQLKQLGIEGTPIYRRDDPLFAGFWRLRKRWLARGRAPCRCGWIDLSVKDVAKQFGIHEATEWYATKRPPGEPTWIAKLDFDPWDLRLVGKCRRS